MTICDPGSDLENQKGFRRVLSGTCFCLSALVRYRNSGELELHRCEKKLTPSLYLTCKKIAIVLLGDLEESRIFFTEFRIFYDNNNPLSFCEKSERLIAEMSDFC